MMQQALFPQLQSSSPQQQQQSSMMRSPILSSLNTSQQQSGNGVPLLSQQQQQQQQQPSSTPTSALPHGHVSPHMPPHQLQQHQLQQQQQQQQHLSQHQIISLLCDILVPAKRRHAMSVLSNHRDVDNGGQMALLLWYSTGVMAVLIQEVIMGYDLLSPEKLTVEAAERLCDALVLMQTVASHQTTCPLFLNAHIPLYVYPFLDTPESSELFERLRLTSLGVIAALFKPEDSKIIRFLLNIEIIPLCLRIMENGSDLNKLLATFIVEKILSFDDGLGYICATPERFYAVSSVLSNMMRAKPESRLAKHIIKCYLRLSEHPRAREALSQCLPKEIREPDMEELNKESDVEGLRKLRVLLLINTGLFQPNREPQNMNAQPQQMPPSGSFMDSMGS